MQEGSVYQAFCKTVDRFADKPFLQLVTDTAERYGQSPQTISYQQAWQQVQFLCGCYHGLKLKPSTRRVALALDNRIEAFLHWLALNALGVSVVPLNPQWRAAELEYIFNHSEVRLVVCLPDRKDFLEKVAATVATGITVLDSNAVELQEATGFQQSDTHGRVQDNQDAQTAEAECALLYTSGTTGKPKGCLLSNEYFLVTGAWYRDIGGLCTLTHGQERLLTPLPMYHMNAMATSTMAMLMTGGCIIPLDRFHPQTFWASVAASQATILHYLGVMPVLLLGLPVSPKEKSHRIRFGFGAGLSGDLHRQFEERFGFMLIEAWAMTETGCTVAVIANQEPRKVGTACFGYPPTSLDYRLVDDDGENIASGTAGELLVRRSEKNKRYGFFSGYLKDHEATKAAWSGGFFHTGDLVVQDPDGALHFVDRKKNIIRRSGENISAVEVEEVLIELPKVLATGVVAVPDAIRGDEVFACVVTASANNLKSVGIEIVRHCLARLAYYKAPAYIGWVAKLPLTATEKIQRGELKTLALTLMQTQQYIDMRYLKSKKARDID